MKTITNRIEKVKALLEELDATIFACQHEVDQGYDPTDYLLTQLQTAALILVDLTMEGKDAH